MQQINTQSNSLHDAHLNFAHNELLKYCKTPTNVLLYRVFCVTLQHKVYFT